jgi:tellurite methyltransferase
MSSPPNEPTPPLSIAALQRALGDTDIYLIDLLLKGRIQPGMRVLDAGCGGGRNLRFLLQAGVEVYGVDSAAGAVEQVRQLAKVLVPSLPHTNFRQEAVEEMSFLEGYFDVVISSAVLHFAKDEPHFDQMLHRMWQVLKPGGILFCRLASSIGLEKRVHLVKGRRYALPDGSTRFLVDEDLLLQRTARLHARLLEPLKTVNVQNLRCMTTWVLQKKEEAP